MDKNLHSAKVVLAGIEELISKVDTAITVSVNLSSDQSDIYALKKAVAYISEHFNDAGHRLLISRAFEGVAIIEYAEGNKKRSEDYMEKAYRELPYNAKLFSLRGDIWLQKKNKLPWYEEDFADYPIKNWLWGVAIAVVIVWFMFGNAKSDSSYSSDELPTYEQVEGSDSCTDDCSGHDAGYEWARDNDVCDTEYDGGDSESFAEGVRSWAENNC
jgi:hypothetical protein